MRESPAISGLEETLVGIEDWFGRGCPSGHPPAMNQLSQGEWFCSGSEPREPLENHGGNRSGVVLVSVLGASLVITAAHSQNQSVRVAVVFTGHLLVDLVDAQPRQVAAPSVVLGRDA
jgi:hypothetical protein